MMRVEWTVAGESREDITIKASDVTLHKDDLLELESVGLKFDFNRADNTKDNVTPFFDGKTNWDEVSIVMQKTDSFVSWQP